MEEWRTERKKADKRTKNDQKRKKNDISISEINTDKLEFKRTKTYAD